MNRIEVCTENYGNASAIDIDVRGSREKFWFSFNDSPNQNGFLKIPTNLAQIKRLLKILAK